MSKSGIIFSPIVSEKSFRLAASGQYTFLVDPRATAPAVAAAISQLYGVTVVKIRTASRRGKVTRYRGRAGSRSDEKKAIVTLKSGQRIAGFEVEQPDAKPEPKKIEKASKTVTADATSKSGVTTKVRSPKAKTVDAAKESK